MATGGSGGWRVTAIPRMTPMAPIATANAAISAARGGPPESALELPTASPSALLTLPKSAQKNLPEVLWTAANLIARWPSLVSSG